MKKIYLSLLFFGITSISCFAQQSGYKQALGVKFPAGFSLTYKNFIDDSHNIEALITSWEKGYRFTALYEFNYYTFNVDGLSWFVGPGVSLGVWDKDYKKEYNNSTNLEINGIIGLDYKFQNTPLNLSVDWQPAISILGSGFNPTSGGIALRCTF